MSKDGEKQQIIETSKIIWENNLYEQYYNPETKETGFIGLSTDKQELLKHDCIEDLATKYAPINDDLLQKGAVLLPFDAIDYHSNQDLEKEIDAFIKKWLDISDIHRKTAVWYVMLSWVGDNLNTIPYLRALGDYGTGKTRYLDVIGGICYKPMFIGGSVRSAPIYRVIDLWRGTAIFDEFTLQKSDETQDIIQILNNGYQRGKPVLRCKDGDYSKVECFDPFGAKILASRKEFYDKALESRCITEILKQTSRQDIPIDFTTEFYKQRTELQNKLLMYRLKNYALVKTDDTVNIDFGQIQPRLKQTFHPFTVLFQHNKKTLEEFIQQIQGYNSDLVDTNSETMDGAIINGYLENLSYYEYKSETPITAQDIQTTMQNDGWKEDKLNVRTIGKHLKTLGFNTIPKFIDNKTKRVIQIDEKQLKQLITRYVPTEKQKEIVDKISNMQTKIIT